LTAILTDSNHQHNGMEGTKKIKKSKCTDNSNLLIPHSYLVLLFTLSIYPRTESWWWSLTLPPPSPSSCPPPSSKLWTFNPYDAKFFPRLIFKTSLKWNPRHTTRHPEERIYEAVCKRPKGPDGV